MLFILLTQTDLYFQNLPQNCYKGAHYASINKKYTHYAQNYASINLPTLSFMTGLTGDSPP